MGIMSIMGLCIEVDRLVFFLFFWMVWVWLGFLVLTFFDFF